MPFGKLSSTVVMIFLLSFLTVGNAFLFSNSAAQGNDITASASNDREEKQRPLSPEEEKPTRSVSNSLTEEYIHHNDLLPAILGNASAAAHDVIHFFLLGDDHSSLDCPPPDYC